MGKEVNNNPIVHAELCANGSVKVTYERGGRLTHANLAHIYHKMQKELGNEHRKERELNINKLSA